MISGCSYSKTTHIYIRGEGVEFPLVLSKIKGDKLDLTIWRNVDVGKEDNRSLED
jgi:hypothetical protein